MIFICIIGALKKTLLNQSNYKNVAVHQEYIQMADMDILSERIELITRFLQTRTRNETKRKCRIHSEQKQEIRNIFK